MGLNYAPEPDHHSENDFNLEPSPIHTHSDTEQEEIITFDGYTLLNYVNVNFTEDSEASDDDTSSESDVNEEESLVKDSIEAEISSEPSTSTLSENTENSSMDEEHINEIKACMNSISIPADAFPEWARDCPESEWVHFLKEKIEEFHKDGNN